MVVCQKKLSHVLIPQLCVCGSIYFLTAFLTWNIWILQTIRQWQDSFSLYILLEIPYLNRYNVTMLITFKKTLQQSVCWVMTLKPSVKARQEQCRVSGPFVALDVRISPFSLLFQKRQTILRFIVVGNGLWSNVFSFRSYLSSVWVFFRL